MKLVNGLAPRNVLNMQIGFGWVKLVMIRNCTLHLIITALFIILNQNQFSYSSDWLAIQSHLVMTCVVCSVQIIDCAMLIAVE